MLLSRIAVRRAALALIVIPFVDATQTHAMTDDYVATSRKALAGDYQARRNMAFCFRVGDDGVVCRGWPRPAPIEACAWRAVVLFSGDRRVDGTDTAGLKIDCGKLDAADLAAAEAKAGRYGQGRH